MTREMQDGINSDAAGMDHAIPLVAYYIDGLYAWTAAEIALFPHSVHVRIAVRWTTRDGHVIDRENGDATAAQAAAWAHQRRLDGYPWPTVYCSVSSQAEVIAAFQAIREPMPLWWLAHYDNIDTLPAGCVAKQYADPGPLDKSIVADYWAGVDQGGNVTDPLDEQITRAGTHYDGTPEVATTTIRAEAAWSDAHWDLVVGLGRETLAAVKGIASLLAQTDADVKAIRQITPADLQQPLHDALTALGWTPPPTTTDTATAVLTAIKTQLTK